MLYWSRECIIGVIFNFDQRVNDKEILIKLKNIFKLGILVNIDIVELLLFLIKKYDFD